MKKIPSTIGIALLIALIPAIFIGYLNDFNSNNYKNSLYLKVENSRFQYTVIKKIPPVTYFRIK